MVAFYGRENLKGKHFALWGLSFKPNTDDMREAPALTIIKSLLEAGATVTAYDPVAMEECAHFIGNDIKYAQNEYEAMNDADALIVATEWSEFRYPNFEIIKKLLAEPVVFDGRNIFDKKEMTDLGFNYHGVGITNTSTAREFAVKAS